MNHPADHPPRPLSVTPLLLAILSVACACRGRADSEAYSDPRAHSDAGAEPGAWLLSYGNQSLSV